MPIPTRLAELREKDYPAYIAACSKGGQKAAEVRAAKKQKDEEIREILSARLQEIREEAELNEYFLLPWVQRQDDQMEDL